MYACMHVLIHVCVCVFVCMYVRMYVCTHATKQNQQLEDVIASVQEASSDIATLELRSELTLQMEYLQRVSFCQCNLAALYSLQCLT